MLPNNKPRLIPSIIILKVMIGGMINIKSFAKDVTWDFFFFLKPFHILLANRQRDALNEWGINDNLKLPFCIFHPAANVQILAESEMAGFKFPFPVL